jgi:hypothetical protein
MKAAPYDIFRKDLLGIPVWMEAVQDLETANLRVMELAGRSPGEYFVFSQETKEIVSSTAPRSFELGVYPSSLEAKTRSHFFCSEFVRVLLGRPLVR